MSDSRTPSNTAEEIATATESTVNNPMEEDEWLRMKLMITDQLDNVTANLDDLRKKGCLESIAFQIERGDRCPSARLISWYLAMLEVEYCSRKDVNKKLDHMFQIHSNSNSKKSFVLETHISRTGKPLGVSDYRSIVEKLEGKTNLSMAERQDLWLAKKNIRNEEAVKEKKDAEEKIRAQSAPNLDISRKSYRAVAVDHKRKPAQRPQSRVESNAKPPAIPNPSRSLSNITNRRSVQSTTKKDVQLRKPTKKTRTRKPISDPFSIER